MPPKRRALTSATSLLKSTLRAVAARAAYCTGVLPGTSASFGVPRAFAVRTCDWFATRSTSIGDRSRYTPLSEESTTRRTAPRFVDAPLQVRVQECLNGRRLPRFVASLADGRFIGRFLGSVVTADDTLLQDVSLNATGWCREVTHKREHLGFTRLTPPVNVDVPGEAIVLNTPFSSNFHHFLLDTVPRLGLCAEAGIDLCAVERIVTDYRRAPYQDEVFAALGIDLARVLPTTGSLHLRAALLHVPSISEPVCREGYIDYSAEGMEFVRRTMRPAIDRKKRRRLLLSRRLAACRRWVEEDEALPALERLGFERVECERLSVREQARLFGEAEAVIMPHGGGMANCVFCEPGTKIFELFHPAYHPVFMLPLSSVLGLDYHAIAGEAAPGGDACDDIPGSVDVRLPADRLLRILADHL